MTTTAITVITFDLDDTLWPVAPALKQAEQAQRQWLQRHRPATLDHLGKEQLLARKRALLKQQPELAQSVSNMRKTFLYQLQRDSGYSDELARIGSEESFAVFLRARQAVTPFPEARPLLKKLAQHYRLGALTNGNADVYKTALGQYIEFAFLAEEVGAAKPAAPLFEAALEKTQAQPSQLLHIGDNPEHDIAGAQALGINTVWLNLQKQSWPESLSPPDASITSLPALLQVLANWR